MVANPMGAERWSCLSALLKPSNQARKQTQMNQAGSEPEGKKALSRTGLPIFNSQALQWEGIRQVPKE